MEMIRIRSMISNDDACVNKKKDSGRTENTLKAYFSH